MKASAVETEMRKRTPYGNLMACDVARLVSAGVAVCDGGLKRGITGFRTKQGRGNDGILYQFHYTDSTWDEYWWHATTNF